MLKNNHIIRVILLAISCMVACSDKNISQEALVVQDSQDTTTSFVSSTEVLKSKHIPDSVFRMVHLKQLTITGMDCDFRILDSQGNDITHCWMIEEIPPQIKNLKELESLQLNVNSIQVIPVELSELKNLKSLDLTDNLSLSDLDNLVLLTHLESLSLNGCNIKKLPVHIGELKKLKLLGLYGNYIDDEEKTRIRKALPNCEIGF